MDAAPAKRRSALEKAIAATHHERRIGLPIPSSTYAAAIAGGMAVISR
jgi:hypothetical protein